MNVGQIINIGPRKFVQNNKCRALNKMCKVMLKNTHIKFVNICRAFNKVIEPGKNPKLINVGPTFILYHICDHFVILSYFRTFCRISHQSCRTQPES